MYQPQSTNDLILARERRGLSRKQASNLLRPLGYSGTSALEEYERGRAHPPLKTALALEIIYRQPVAFLWPQLYQQLRSEIRAHEREQRATEEQNHA